MEVFARSRVTTVTTIRRTRRMPPSAVPTVTLSKPVKAQDVVAVNEIPGPLRIVRLADALRTDATKAESYLRRRLGDHVAKGEVLAERRRGLRRLRVVAPIEGTIVHITHGQVLIEGERRTEEVYASVPGRVVMVESGKQVTIETVAALVQIAWGTGGLAWGTLRVMDAKPTLQADASRFNIDHRGAIVAIAAPLTEEFVKAAAEIRPKGLIAGSMPSSLIPKLRELDFPVGISQGFGQLAMTDRILNLLNTYNGREIALDMATSGDWRETRPEIIIPVTGQTAPEDRAADNQFRVGQKARILQKPPLGEIAAITALPSERKATESGLWLNGAMVQLPSGETLFVPFANLEHLG